METRLYKLYKGYELRAFQLLFSHQAYHGWSLKQFRTEAANHLPGLDHGSRNNIVKLLEQSIDLRNQITSFYQHAPRRGQIAHAAFVSLLKDVTRIVTPPEPTDILTVDEPEPTDSLTVDEAEPTDSLTVDEAEFLHFLAAIQTQVAVAVDLWRELILGKKRWPLAAVSLAANTCLYEVMTMVHVAEILNPRYFTNELDLTGKSDYYTRLQGLRSREAVGRAFTIFAEPADESKLSARQAHIPYRFLGRDSKEAHTGTLAPLRMAIAFEYAYQVHNIYADPENELQAATTLSVFRDQVEALISETDAVLRENAESMGATNPLGDRSKTTLETMKKYAREARDILALGFVAETVECPHIECAVQLLSCPLVRMFACGYESLRLSRASIQGALHPRLENFFQLPVVKRLLWLDGRPVSTKDCEKLFLKSFIREYVASHWKTLRLRIDRLFRDDCVFLNLRAQRANSLKERDNSLYRLTNDLRKRLDGRRLEAHLAEELRRFSEVTRIRRELIATVRSLAGNELSFAGCYRWLNEYLHGILTVDVNGVAFKVPVVVIKGESVYEIIKRFPVD